MSLYREPLTGFPDGDHSFPHPFSVLLGTCQKASVSKCVLCPLKMLGRREASSELNCLLLKVIPFLGA